MYKKIVIKIGTGVITDSKGDLSCGVIEKIVSQVSKLKRKGVEIVLVTSGAMGAGRARIKAPKGLDNVSQRQLHAAVGQGPLIGTYGQYFEEQKYQVAQVLATKEDFRDKHHYQNMKNCFEVLLGSGVVPIVNENDVVAIEELMFTDNDDLAGFIASMIEADALIILSTVDGILDDKGKIISTIKKEDKGWKKFISSEKSSFGKGGMATKSDVAQNLALAGITTHIVNGSTDDVLMNILKGDKVGTVFLS